jgi:hypothetical protein
MSRLLARVHVEKKSMRVKLFEILEKAGLIKRHTVQPPKVFNMPLAKVLDTLDAATASTLEPAIASQATTNSHCASIDLSGGRDECVGMTCRLNTAHEVAHFAALYSDRAFIHNFLADYSQSWGHPSLEDSNELRENLLNDMYILLQLRPLIEGNCIAVFSPPANTCPYCYAKRLFGSKANQRLQQAVRRLTLELRKTSQVELYLGA